MKLENRNDSFRRVRGLWRSGLPALLVAVLSAPAVQAQIAFTDVSGAAGVGVRGETYGASWGDLNNDGFLDLYTSNHRLRDSLYLNMRNGKFVDVATQVLTWRNRQYADTHGGTWSDYDNDGDMDLLVSTGTGNLSQFLRNENQRLVDRTLGVGLSATNVGGRLPIWLDFNGDKLSDFVMTQYGGIARLHRQDAGGGFTEITLPSKLGLQSVSLRAPARREQRRPARFPVPERSHLSAEDLRHAADAMGQAV